MRHERAVTILGDPWLRPLVDELAQRMSASDRPVVRVTLRDLDQQARTALAELLRLDHIPPAKVHVDVQRLARALHIEASDVVAVVERIRGPLDNRARARAAAATARAVAADRLAEAAMAVDHRLCDWARRQAIAVDGDLDAQVATVEAALQVLAAAYEAQPEPLPVVACRVLGDPHAADLDRNVGRVLRSALGTLGLEGSVREHMLKGDSPTTRFHRRSRRGRFRFPPITHPLAGTRPVRSSL